MLVFLEFFVCLSPPSSQHFTRHLPYPYRSATRNQSCARPSLIASRSARSMPWSPMVQNLMVDHGLIWYSRLYCYMLYMMCIYIRIYIRIDTPKMIWECWSQIDGIDWAFGDVCFTSGPQDVCWIKELGGWNCADIWSLVISYCTELCRDLILDVNTIQQPGVDPVACRW